MGIFWIFKFIFFPLGMRYQLLLFIFIGLTLYVPFLGYKYGKKFRDIICGGKITFMQSWIFLIFMYMFAALLTAVAHYVYFRFLDNGFVVDTYTNVLEMWTNMDLPAFQPYVEQMKLTIELVRSLSPIEITMQLLSSNVLYCSILSLITAPFIMKNNPQYI